MRGRWWSRRRERRQTTSVCSARDRAAAETSTRLRHVTRDPAASTSPAAIRTVQAARELAAELERGALTPDRFLAVHTDQIPAAAPTSSGPLSDPPASALGQCAARSRPGCGRSTTRCSSASPAGANAAATDAEGHEYDRCRASVLSGGSPAGPAGSGAGEPFYEYQDAAGAVTAAGAPPPGAPAVEGPPRSPTYVLPAALMRPNTGAGIRVSRPVSGPAWLGAGDLVVPALTMSTSCDPVVFPVTFDRSETPAVGPAVAKDDTARSQHDYDMLVTRRRSTTRAPRSDGVALNATAAPEGPDLGALSRVQLVVLQSRLESELLVVTQRLATVDAEAAAAAAAVEAAAEAAPAPDPLPPAITDKSMCASGPEPASRDPGAASARSRAVGRRSSPGFYSSVCEPMPGLAEALLEQDGGGLAERGPGARAEYNVGGPAPTGAGHEYAYADPVADEQQQPTQTGIVAGCLLTSAVHIAAPSCRGTRAVTRAKGSLHAEPPPPFVLPPAYDGAAFGAGRGGHGGGSAAPRHGSGAASVLPLELPPSPPPRRSGAASTTPPHRGAPITAGLGALRNGTQMTWAPKTPPGLVPTAPARRRPPVDAAVSAHAKEISDTVLNDLLAAFDDDECARARLTPAVAIAGPIIG